MYRQKTDLAVKQFFFLHKLSFCKRTSYCSLKTTTSTSNELCHTLMQAGTTLFGQNMGYIIPKLHVKERFTERKNRSNKAEGYGCNHCKHNQLHPTWCQQNLARNCVRSILNVAHRSKTQTDVRFHQLNIPGISKET